MFYVRRETSSRDFNTRESQREVAPVKSLYFMRYSLHQCVICRNQRRTNRNVAMNEFTHLSNQRTKRDSNVGKMSQNTFLNTIYLYTNVIH